MRDVCISFLHGLHEDAVHISKKKDEFLFNENIIIHTYWDSLHAKLNSHYEAWRFTKKKHRKIKAYKKFV